MSSNEISEAVKLKARTAGFDKLKDLKADSIKNVPETELGSGDASSPSLGMAGTYIYDKSPEAEKAAPTVTADDPKPIEPGE